MLYRFSVDNILDIYEYTEGKDIPGAILWVDFEKASDSVEHSFRISALRKMFWGENV